LAEGGRTPPLARDTVRLGRLLSHPRLITPSDFTLRPGRFSQPTAALTIDVESDYDSQQYEGLERLEDLIAVVRSLGVPLTAFVEGRFFEDRRSVCDQLVSAGADIQLHCWDHRSWGDGVEDLQRSIEAYRRLLGRPPEGYRAHTYRLTPELVTALMANGFRWDSSILPAVAHAGHTGWRSVRTDYYVLAERLVEFPLAVWPMIGIPLTHSYRLLLRPIGEALFRRVLGWPQTVVYDMHMVDLVWTKSLRRSPLPAHVKWMYRYMWGTNRGDSFASLRAFVTNLRRGGYRFTTLSTLCQEVAPTPAAPHRT